MSGHCGDDSVSLMLTDSDDSQSLEDGEYTSEPEFTEAIQKTTRGRSMERHHKSNISPQMPERRKRSRSNTSTNREKRIRFDKSNGQLYTRTYDKRDHHERMHHHRMPYHRRDHSQARRYSDRSKQFTSASKNAFMNEPNDTLQKMFALGSNFQFEKTCIKIHEEATKDIYESFKSTDPFWAPRLFDHAHQFSYSAHLSNPKLYSIPYDVLRQRAPSLKGHFVCSADIKAEQVTVRSQMMISESLISFLACCDEVATWLLLHREYEWPIDLDDPIFACIPTMRDLLKLKMTPFLECHLKKFGLTEWEVLSGIPKIKAHVQSPLTFLCYMLNTLSKAITTLKGSVGSVVKLNCFDRYEYLTAHYKPGMFMTGVTNELKHHKCADKNQTKICKLSINTALFPVYLAGKYFYCNNYEK